MIFAKFEYIVLYKCFLILAYAYALCLAGRKRREKKNNWRYVILKPVWMEGNGKKRNGGKREPKFLPIFLSKVGWFGENLSAFRYVPFKIAFSYL